MFISRNSLQNFVFINGFLLSLGFTQHALIYFFTQNIHGRYIYEFCVIFIMFISRNYLLLNWIDYGTRNKRPISYDIENAPIEEYPHEFDYYVAKTTALKLQHTSL